MSVGGFIGDVVRELLVPPQGFVFLFLLGLLLQKWWARVGKILSVSCLIILFAMATNQGSLLLVSPLEHYETPLKSAQGSGAQAIVVLTAGRTRSAAEYGGKDIPDYVAQTRIHYAVKLYHETHLPILVSGGLGPSEGNAETLALEMARVFEKDFQVPVKWQEDQSTDTAENAALSAVILKQAGVKKILLVTDAMHMHRARLAFEKVGLEVIAAPTTFYSERDAFKISLRSMDEYFRQSTYAMHEWIGLGWYQLSNKI